MFTLMAIGSWFQQNWMLLLILVAVVAVDTVGIEKPVISRV